MMIIPDIPDDADVRVFSGCEVYSASQNGWRFAAVVSAQSVEQSQSSFPNPIKAANEHGYSSVFLEEGVVSHVVESPLFLMYRTRTNSDLATQLDAARKEARALTCEIETVKSQLDSKDSRASRAKAIFDNVAQDRDKARVNLNEARDTMRKYETDLGKIREAIGTKQMESILGGPDDE